MTTAVDAARANIAATARSLDRTLASVVPMVEQVASQIESGRLAATQVAPVLESSLREHGLLETLGVAYDPAASPDRRRLFAPFAVRRSREVATVCLDSEYDYTEFRHRWYGDAMLDGRQWNEPVPIHPGRPFIRARSGRPPSRAPDRWNRPS